MITNYVDRLEGDRIDHVGDCRSDYKNYDYLQPTRTSVRRGPSNAFNLPEQHRHCHRWTI